MKAKANTNQADSMYSSATSSLSSKSRERFFSSSQSTKSLFFSGAAVQAKLKIGQSDDKYEREADRVADAVKRMPDPGVQRKPEEKEEELQMKQQPDVQQKCEECEEEEKLQKKAKVKTSGSGKSFAGQQLSNRIKSTAGNGNRLPSTILSEVGQKMGADFSGVNIHTDSDSHQLNRQLGARAFTHGNDIYFNKGEYSPDSQSGKQLLAHELTHVVQQKDHKTIQRFFECENEDECSRDSGEYSDSRTTPMLIENIVSPYQGLLISNFGIGDFHLKSDFENQPNWARFWGGMVTNQNIRWKILGFTDCGGEEGTNRLLRWQRAIVVNNALPQLARNQVNGFRAAPLNECVDTNDAKENRSHNRSVFIQQVSTSYEFEGENVEVPKPMFGARTSEASMFNIRAQPGTDGEVIGKLALREMTVNVIAEHGNDIENIWYQVVFSEEDFRLIQEQYTREMGHEPPAYEGTTVWVSSAAFSQVYVTYDEFLELLNNFEEENEDDSLRDRLTRLRQIGEDASLEGDQVVGRGENLSNRITQGDRTLDESEPQLFLEAKQIIMPNGEVIDMHHFILGLDALVMPESGQSENREVYYFGPLNIDIGQSYSAATWSGDIGGAVGDYVMHRSSVWEEENTSEDNQERLEFYFRTRAPEMDLLADFDAWGRVSGLPETSDDTSSYNSLRDIIEAHYGQEGQSALEYEQTVTSVRRRGLDNFLCHYGFNSVDDLNSQTDARRRVFQQVFIFAQAWYNATEGTPTHTDETEDALETASTEMTQIFLDWIETKTEIYNVENISCEN